MDWRMVILKTAFRIATIAALLYLRRKHAKASTI